MKKLPFILSGLCFLLLTFSASFGQDSSMIKWSYTIKQINAKQYEINLNGNIPSGWHLYNADVTDEMNGIVVSTPDSSLKVEKVNIQQSNIKTIVDPVFDRRTKKVFENQVSVIALLTNYSQSELPVKINISYEVGNAETFIPEEQKIKIVLNEQKSENIQTRILIPTIDLSHPVNDCGSIQSGLKATNTKSLWSIFLIGFLGGLVALLTPCVFPMIPLTVSFFTKKASTKKSGITNAFLYGFFIFFIYILLSLPFHFLDSINPEFLNNISTNVYLNIIFFAVFVFFAFSFFGFYEITLPASLSSGADSKAGSGNVLGIFFMALTLALVSFSCTGPILGTLLVGSLQGGAWALTQGMAGFGFALALPFTLFAIFPQWLQSLPKSGGWLDTVKKVLAFLELALAFKFLSNADLVQHWGLLKREVFLAIWAIISIGLALYLSGYLLLPHDVKGATIARARKVFALVAFGFAILLFAGMTPKNAHLLKFLSGFPPPTHYSYLGNKNNQDALQANVVNDYDQALALSKAQNKPILIDFTGWACVNCRKMEENVWSDPAVSSYIKEHYILLSLYVDDKAMLPIEKRFTYHNKLGQSKAINSVGDLWATFQAENFNQVTQPLYVVLSPSQQLLSHPVGYTPNVSDYLGWLQCSAGK